MRPYSVEEIARITGGTVLYGDPSLKVTSASTDSRKIAPGGLFGALVGERSDGHDFVADVFRKGAGGAIIERPVAGLRETVEAGRPGTPPGGFGVIMVGSTAKALQALAAHYRSELPTTVIGVTGSVGKTSAKDMVCSVLGSKFATYGNPGNLNSHIGLPLAVLAMEGTPQYAVLEMAMRARGEIADLCAIARPRLGILTDISMSHVGVLGSVEEIALAKAELLESLPPDGVAIVSGDNEWVRRMSSRAKCPVVFYGFSAGCDVRAVDVESLGAGGSRFRIETGTLPLLRSSDRGGRDTAGKAAAPREFVLRTPGAHQVHNALAAIAVGFVTGIPYESVRYGLENAAMSPMRLDVTQAGSVVIINDAYNASPKSMKAALDLLSAIGKGRKVAILGDMLEMGDYGPAAHRDVGRYARTRASCLLCAGDLGKEIKAGWDEGKDGGDGMSGETGAPKTSSWFPDKGSLAASLRDFIRGGDACLVKASRGMGFETVVEALKELSADGRT
jgi:UDP-N-acetylmuramoyl-tripeptide--D-alanyl-D-alanine ligase